MLTVKELEEKFKENNYDVITMTNEGMLMLAKEERLITDIETDETLVIYKALYENRETYARPIDMFLEKVDKTKYPDAKQDFRFETVELK